jgi:methionine synthase I (cobalamin-dependent)
MPDIVKALHSGRVLLMDGAMGTELFRAGVPRDACLEELNLTRPEVVQRIHRAYVEAGAEVVLTNTFQANPQHLRRFCLDEKMDAIHLAGVQLARAVATERAIVLASIGPALLESDAQIQTLARSAAYVDGIVLETWGNLDAAARFADCNWAFGSTGPAFISFAFRRNAAGRLCTCDKREMAPEECGAVVLPNRFAALGVNCGVDIRLPELLEIITQYRSVTDLPLFVRPNAGTPKQIDGQWVYPETPESMAAWLPALFEAGVVMVGGCCGTTPAHIAAFRKVVDEWNQSHAGSESEF